MTTEVHLTGLSRVEQRLHELQEMLDRRDLAGALRSAEALSEEVPENRDVLYLMAIALRFLGRVPEALVVLDRLRALHPGFSRQFQERGHCYVALRDAPAAIDSFLRAVNINPALPASWGMLESLYRLTGQHESAATAAAHGTTLRALPAEVLHADSLFSDGDLDHAEQLIRAFLMRNGDHVEGMRLLARIGLARGVLDDAELLLAGVLRLAPDYVAARTDYIQTLVDRNKYLQAREELTKLARVQPLDRPQRTLAATVAVGLGEHEEAIGLFRR